MAVEQEIKFGHARTEVTEGQLDKWKLTDKKNERFRLSGGHAAQET